MVLQAIKFNSFKRMSIVTLNYNSMGGPGSLSSIGNQKDITISVMTMKTAIYINRQKPKIR